MSRLCIFVAVLLAVTSPMRAAGAVNAADENALKVAFIVNFTKFIVWPENTAPSEQVVTIAVWDYESLKPVLDGYGEDALLKQKVRFVPLDPQCEEEIQVMYVNSNVQENVLQGLRCATKSGPVLTVGEFERFPDFGGMINFVPRRDTIGFELNLNAIQSQSLSISSHLIRLGTVVHGSTPSPSTGQIVNEPLGLVAWVDFPNVRR